MILIEFPANTSCMVVLKLKCCQVTLDNSEQNFVLNREQNSPKSIHCKAYTFYQKESIHLI